MTTKLYRYPEFQNDIAVTKNEFIDGGLFFLDFSKPLQHFRRFGFGNIGIENKWIGFTISLAVPVIHQDETEGMFIIVIHKHDPYFKNILSFWKENYPKKRDIPKYKGDAFKIVADFANQFPDSR